MAIVIRSGQFISRMTLGINPTGISGAPAGGTVDISTFPNLTGFFANGCGLSNIIGLDGQSRFRAIDVSSNRLAIPCPSIAQNSGLVSFTANNNRFTGSIPTFGNNAILSTYHIGMNPGISGAYPVITGLTGLQNLYTHGCNLNGPLPPITRSNPALFRFWSHTNKITGSIPNFVTGTVVLDYQCQGNLLSGDIPDLRPVQTLRTFNCSINNLTGFTGNFPTGLNGTTNNRLTVNCTANALTFDAVSRLLQAAVDSSCISGTLNLQGGTNASPTGATNTANINTLTGVPPTGRGWTITRN